MTDFKVVFQDDYLMVLDKPAGLVVDDSDTYTGLTLSQILINDFHISLERGGIVHRLDKDTSGLILVAKNQSVLESLQSQFKERTVKKVYMALVHGILKEDREVVGAIARNPGDRRKFTVIYDGKEASTDFKPVRKLVMSDQTIDTLFPDFSKIQRRKLTQLNYPDFTLVHCYPKTGRTHQIRVHLKYIGFPIVSDSTYGGRKVVRLDHQWCPRQFLHASKLEFDHPVSGERIKLESPLPSDLEKALKLLNYD